MSRSIYAFMRIDGKNRESYTSKKRGIDMKRWMRQYSVQIGISGILLCALVYKLMAPWQEIGKVHGIGASLAGTFVMGQHWRLLWTCDSPGALTFQVDSESGMHLLETTD